MSNGAVYINKEIQDQAEDYIGFSAQTDSISEAIEKGAKMIAIVGDYGSGKSSLVELVSQKKHFDKPIKVNMWDSIQKSPPQDGDDKLTLLEKSLLYQIALHSNNKQLARHVNKRLNSSSGLLSLTFTSKAFLRYLIVAIVSFAIGLILQSISFCYTIPQVNIEITNNFYLLFYLTAAVALVCGLVRHSAAFTSWKSEGKRSLDSSDVFSIYLEIVENIATTSKKIIVIEDLDRIDGDSNVIELIKTIYRLSNLSYDKGICFILAIKPSSQLKEKCNYNKYFDFILDLKPIHIDDFYKILKRLLEEKSDSLKSLLNSEITDDVCAQFSYLCGGYNLTIRILKHRLNSAITLYKSIKDKEYESVHPDISIETCCAVAYLESQYENDFFTLINNAGVFVEIISKGYEIRLRNELTREEKKIELFNYMLAKKAEGQAKNLFTIEFCSDFVAMVIDGIIETNFRQYFYTYPNGCYIKSIEESKLEDAIIFNQKPDNDSFSLWVKEALNRGGKVIDDALQRLIDLKKLLPTNILSNEQLLEYCCQKYQKYIVATMVDSFQWNRPNYMETVEMITNICNYSFSERHTLLKDYAQRICEKTTIWGQDGINCRLSLLQTIGKDIVDFDIMFKNAKSPHITETEILLLDNDLLFKLITVEKLTPELITAISDKLVYPLSDEHRKLLFDMIRDYLDSTKINVSVAKALIKILKENQVCDDIIFECIMKQNATELTPFIEEYLSVIDKPLSPAYCKSINETNYQLLLNQNILDSLYNSGNYLAYLKKVAAQETLMERDYNVEIFTEDLIRDFYNTNKTLFLLYRKNLLTMSDATQASHTFMYKPDYPFISEQEAVQITCKQLIALVPYDTINLYRDKFIEILKQIVLSSDDAKQICMHILCDEITAPHVIFKAIPFEHSNYRGLESSVKKIILDRYEKYEKLDTIDKIYQYCSITQDLPRSLEKCLCDTIDANLGKNEPVVKSCIDIYMQLVRKLDHCSDLTTEAVIKYKYEGALPPSVTINLYNLREFKLYLIGRTLYEEKFVFDPTIDLDIYLEINEKNKDVHKYLLNNEEFLLTAYENRKFARLSERQLRYFNKWGQRIELVQSVMDKITDMDARKEYIMGMERFDSLEDSDSIQQFFCTEEFIVLLKDKEISDKIYSMLWQEHPWRRAAFTRFVNKIA